jgi:hypothetical protein
MLMSVTNLMTHTVAPSDIEFVAPSDTEFEHEVGLHDHTYGITSDPLTQFACAFR